MPILIQVNTSNEAQKNGIAPEQLMDLIKEAITLSHVKIEGLMTIAVHSDDEEKVRACFRDLRQLFENAKSEIRNAKWLSMGMSNDYRLAIEEGANMVRIGKILF